MSSPAKPAAPPSPRERGTRVPQQARSRRTRERALEAAAACFEEKGFDETTTAEIARRAGISVGSVYDYFDDKRAILLELLRGTVEVVANTVVAGLDLAHWQDDDPRPAVRNLVHLVFHSRDVHPGIQRILWERFFKDSEFRGATEAIERRVMGAIVTTLEELKRRGRLRIEDVETAAYVIHLSIEWVSSRLVLGDDHVSLDAAVDSASDMIVRFLFPDPIAQ